MTMKIQCPCCSQRYEVSSEDFGKVITCQACGKDFTVANTTRQTGNAAGLPFTPVRLNFSDVMKAGFDTGVKNLFPLLGAWFLWVLTIWIPYINIGTTIAIVNIPIELAKGKTFSPTSIFDKKYRQYMGEFFLVLGLKWMALQPAFALCVFPGIILMLAWSQAVFLVLDKGVNPAEALTLSNKMMDGNKWVSCGINFLLGITFWLGIFFWARIMMIIPGVGGVLLLAWVACSQVVSLGVTGVIYGKLTQTAARSDSE
ncbi:MAG: zinc-ribbon domain-containing protein [Kiritimatiellaeota bacterium]|nr:zinc-ribbon domain-containing protein [Kiritimatiellota bacterium]